MNQITTLDELETVNLNGIEFYFRLLTIKDKDLYLEAFNRLSKTSRKYRFHQIRKNLTEKDLKYFLEIDNHDHLAIGVGIKINDKEYGVGVIRYVREKDQPECADIGLTIIDSFQHVGLGTLLYKKMIQQAKKHGIKTLSNHVLNDNRNMIKLLSKFDGVTTKQFAGTSIINVSIK